jgi:hypothetical protein
MPDTVQIAGPLMTQPGTGVDSTGFNCVGRNERRRKVSPELCTQLAQHRSDYLRRVGKPFQYFYCPILHVDEQACLQCGHIINKAFDGSPNSWVVQRKDVDNFYGSMFEADFEVIQHSGKKTIYDIFADKKLNTCLRPRIFRGRTKVKHFPYRRGPVPPGYCKVDLKSLETDKPFPMCLNCPVEQALRNDPDDPWWIEVDDDVRVAALVSLIKAAHLTMFSLLGYNYALSNAGVFMGHDILGKFFRDNESTSKKQTLSHAIRYFHEFRHMVQPLLPGSRELEGTLSDGVILLCASSTGHPWGMIVFVKTSDLRNAVLLPYPGNPDSVSVYYEFLTNDNTSIHVMEGRFDEQEQTWRIDPEHKPLSWPKSSETYPLKVPSFSERVGDVAD